MHGYVLAGPLQKSPVELAARAAVSLSVATWLSIQLGPIALHALIPYLETAVSLLDSNYRISFALGNRGGNGVYGGDLMLKGQAIVVNSFSIITQTANIHLRPGPAFPSHTAVGLLMQPVMMIVAVLLGWPVRSRCELAARAVLGAMAVGAWLLVGLPATLWIYFRDVPLRAFVPGEMTYATVVGKFFLNGGSLGVGGLVAAFTIAAAVRWSRVPSTTATRSRET